ncbi:hypothetical protein [Xanthomonas hydrangeae]|uniref:hypothetical protein n=1 Tax=Xanthomonas hydrangeae TaxID=2775159 RepID=UPI001B35452B
MPQAMRWRTDARHDAEEGRSGVGLRGQLCTRDMPVYAGIGARQEYLGKIQCGDGFEKSITAWALIAQVCRKQARESNVPDSPAGQIAAFRPNSLMRVGWIFYSAIAENTH